MNKEDTFRFISLMLFIALIIVVAINISTVDGYEDKLDRMSDKLDRQSDIVKDLRKENNTLKDDVIFLQRQLDKERAEPDVESLGTFKITAYNGDGSSMEGGSNNCFGEPLEHGMISVDPNVIPLNSVVYINGQQYRACDTGQAINGKHIDMYIDTDQRGLYKHGIKYLEVYTVKEM